jgi:hypothetical protein
VFEGFTADSNGHGAAVAAADPLRDVLGPVVTKRLDELGQSIFLVATANGGRGGQLPSFLYRIRPTECVGDAP